MSLWLFYSGNSTYINSYHLWSFVTGFFHLTYFFKVYPCGSTCQHLLIIDESYSIVRAYRILIIHSSVDGHLSCFRFLGIMNNSVRNTRVQDLVWTYVFSSLGYALRSGIAESYGNFVLSILRNCSTVFPSGCDALHSHQQRVRVPHSPHPRRRVLLSAFFISAVLVGVEGYLIVVLICISLTTNDAGHLFVCLLAICIFSLEKCLFKLFTHF